MLHDEKDRIHKHLVGEHKRLVQEFGTGKSQYDALKKELEELKGTASKPFVFFLSGC